MFIFNTYSVFPGKIIFQLPGDCKFFTFKCVNVYYRKNRKENHFIMAFNVTIVFQYFCPNKKLKHWHFEAWLLPKRGNAVCPQRTVSYFQLKKFVLYSNLVFLCIDFYFLLIKTKIIFTILNSCFIYSLSKHIIDIKSMFSLYFYYINPATSTD